VSAIVQPSIYTTQKLKERAFAQTTVRAGEALSNGWIPVEGTFKSTAGSTLLTCSKECYGSLLPGVKIRIKQADSTSFKYFYVTATVAIGGTTFKLELNGGSDFSLATSSTYPITNLCYSRDETPAAFPHLFNWTPTFAGYTAQPTGVVATFSLKGKRIFLDVSMPNTAQVAAGGVITFTLPATALSLANRAWHAPAMVVNAGVALAAQGIVILGSGATSAGIYIDATYAAFTVGGQAKAQFSLSYDI
jgi:hypothetical protein